MSNVFILSTLDLSLSDGIHTNSSGNIAIGQRAALRGGQRVGAHGGLGLARRSFQFGQFGPKRGVGCGAAKLSRGKAALHRQPKRQQPRRVQRLSPPAKDGMSSAEKP